MRKHEYLSDRTSNSDTLMLSCVDHWIQYAERRNPSAAVNTKYVPWHCYMCKSDINVKYNTSTVKDMYCARCRPEKLILEAIVVRYFNVFKRYVRNLIIENSGLE